MPELDFQKERANNLKFFLGTIAALLTAICGWFFTRFIQNENILFISTIFIIVFLLCAFIIVFIKLEKTIKKIREL